MRSAPIQALVLWVGAGVMGAVLLKERQDETANCHTVVPPGAALAQPATSEVRPVAQSVPSPRPDPPVSGLRASSEPVQRIGQIVRMKVTAYCCCQICCEKWSGGGKTSIGDNANIFDGVAADPKLLPYRTKLDIPGIGVREVDDTGGAMRQDAKRGIYHIDVRMASHSAARQWGVRWLDVKVLK